MYWFRNIDTGHAFWQGGALALVCYTICCLVTTACADVGLVEVDKQRADQWSSVFRVSLQPRPQDKGEFGVSIGGSVLPDKPVTATLVVGDGHMAQLRGRLHVAQDPKQGNSQAAMWRATLSVRKEMMPSCAVEILIDDPPRASERSTASTCNRFCCMRPNRKPSSGRRALTGRSCKLALEPGIERTTR